MVSVTMNANYDGQPLTVLADLIKERQRILGESAEDAVIATGIDALISLRALTRIAKAMIPKSDVRFGREKPKWIMATRGRNAGKPLRRVVVGRWRNGVKKNATHWQPASSYSFTKRGKPKVKHATAEERTAAWNRWGRITNRGLAKRVLGLAMKQLSTRNVDLGAANARLARIAQANVRVYKTGSADRFALDIRDSLGYALAALKGGSASVDLALQRAANKIAGRLCKASEKKFGVKVETPFPEVRK